MTSKAKRLLGLVVVFAVGLAALAAGPAGADPSGAKFSLPVTATCGGTTVEAVVNGNGAWGPAHDLNSTAVFIPIQFGPATGSFTDPDGNVDPINDPASPPKGSASPPGRTIVTCTYAIDQTFPDGSHLTVNGSVTGYFSG
jgi:hypothetical protein